MLLGLRALEHTDLGPAELADALAEVDSSAADQAVALEDAICARRPDLADALARCRRGPRYVPVTCPGCGARFRLARGMLDPGSHCPLCGECILGGRGLAVVSALSERGTLRAAEGAATYVAGPGTLAGRFRLRRVIGRGGAGTVYEALDTTDDRPVAVKVLDFEPLESASASLHRLRRESRLAARVKHPNVVSVLDMGIDDGVPFIAMELVRGRSLAQLIRKDGPPAAREACRLCLQALGGLAAVHAAGIVHGDVKPANIMVDEGGRARVTDFGVSRFIEETTSVTTGNTLVGSPAYMAPEQWRGERLTPQTDLYAAGLVLFTAATGLRPYGAESPVVLMYKHLHEPVLPPGVHYSTLPRYLADVVRRATQKRPEDRFADAAEFADTLTGFLDGRAPS